MTARAKARACTAAALTSLTAGLIAAPWHAGAAIAGLASTVLLTLAAASYRRQHAADTERAARPVAFPDPAPMPDYERLDEQARYDAAFEQILRHYDDQEAA